MTHITKKQHYVPQCLLRHFAANERVSVFDSSRANFRRNRHIKEEFAENYLYDSNNEVENLLARIEDEAAPHIASYADCRIGIDEKVPPSLARFVAVQYFRTLGARSEMENLIDAFSSRLIRQIGELNNLPTEGVKLKLNDPNSLMRRQTVLAAHSLWRVLLDLRPKLLVNRTRIPFIMSDHPVVHYNWYLRDSVHPARTALTAVGLQMFVPLSSAVTLCLYDATTYKVGRRGGSVVDVCESSDVELLNSMQAMSRENLILIGKSGSEDYVRSLCAKFNRLSLHTSNAVSSNPAMSHGKLRSTVGVSRDQRPLPSWLSVVAVRRNVRRRRNQFRERSPELSEQVEEMTELLNARD